MDDKELPRGPPPSPAINPQSATEEPNIQQLPCPRFNFVNSNTGEITNYLPEGHMECVDRKSVQRLKRYFDAYHTCIHSVANGKPVERRQVIRVRRLAKLVMSKLNALAFRNSTCIKHTVDLWRISDRLVPCVSACDRFLEKSFTTKKNL